MWKGNKNQFLKLAAHTLEDSFHHSFVTSSEPKKTLSSPVTSLLVLEAYSITLDLEFMHLNEFGNCY